MRRMMLIPLVLAVALAAATPTLAQKANEAEGQIKLDEDQAAWLRIQTAVTDGDVDAALTGLTRLIEASRFKTYDVQDQRMIVLFRVALAAETGRGAQAHGFARAATAMDSAQWDEWSMRLITAQLVQDWDDVALVVINRANNDPDFFATFEPVDISRLANMSRRGTGGVAAQSRVVDALFTAGLGKGLSFHLLEHAGRLVDAGEMDRALPMVRAITEPKARLGMAADLRFVTFREVVPEAFDVLGALDAKLEENRVLAQVQPDDLAIQRTYAALLRDRGRVEEALTVLDGALRRAEAIAAKPGALPIDSGDHAWALNARALVLMDLGRRDEAVADLRRAARMPESGRANVSQTINLGSLYNRLGRHEAALDAVSDIRDGGASPYGLVQAEQVRACAYAALGRSADLKRTLDSLRTRQDDAVDTVGGVAICTRDEDLAARDLIERLNDPDRRNETLRDLQDYLPRLSPTVYDTANVDFSRAIKERPDVSAAIARVGVIRSWPILGS